MTLSEKEQEFFERYNERRKKKRQRQIQKWHEAGVKARKKKKERERKEREKEKNKRPVGRPKKRGPKKKRRAQKPKIYKQRPRITFKIVGVTNGRQNEFVGAYYTAEDAYKALDELKKKNDEIVFQRKLINNNTLKESVDEWLLLEKNFNNSDEVPLLRNEFGKLVEQRTNNKKWKVFDKIPRVVEETFWVYGYDPLTDRKTFKWIYDNMINVFESEYDLKRILIFKNKIIIKKDNKDFDMIICKNVSDAIRFYNKLSEMYKKSKQVFFIGCFDKVSDRRRELEKEIKDKTGWDKRKIQSVSTRS